MTCVNKRYQDNKSIYEVILPEPWFTLVNTKKINILAFPMDDYITDLWNRTNDNALVVSMEFYDTNKKEKFTRQLQEIKTFNSFERYAKFNTLKKVLPTVKTYKEACDTYVNTYGDSGNVLHVDFYE